MNKLLSLLLLCHSVQGPLLAQSFEKISPDINLNNSTGYLVSADLDNDGDPEIILAGYDGFKIFNNTNGNFEQPVEYPEFKGESQLLVHTLDVGDIDRDGFIDVLQSGGPNRRIFNILLNQNPGFTDIAGNHVNGLAGASFLGDLEGDGDLDIIYSGADNVSNSLQGILINRKGSFIGGPWFTRHHTVFATWCDFDHDTKLEVIQCTEGFVSIDRNFMLESGFPSMKIIKNLSIGTYVYNASFADYDGDGDLDMLAKMNPNQIYNNVNGDFIPTDITFPYSKTAEFADVNNDGLYDVVVGGMMTPTWWTFETGVYINQNNGTFAKLDAQIPAFENYSASISDVDGDGDLDIPTQEGVFRNNSTVINLKPSTPMVIGSIVSGSAVTLNWQASTDDHSPPNMLTYNIEVRNEAGEIIVPCHSLSSGKRQLFKIGNAYNNVSFDLSCLQQGTYYWKVQALDASYQGSEFSVEHSFTVTTVPPVAPLSLTAKPYSDVAVELTWTDQSETEDEFVILRNSPHLPLDFFPIDTVEADGTHYIDSIYLESNTSYSYRVIASNCAYPDEFFSAASAKTFLREFVESGWLDLGEAEGQMVLLGDYDNDADLDMLLSYSGSQGTKLFRFNGNGYEDSGIKFSFGAAFVTWIDYNKDNFIDILFSDGRLYKNMEGSSFTEVIDHGFPPRGTPWNISYTSPGDYDNDGDEDLLIASSTVQIYDNNGKGKYIKNSNINFNGHVKSNCAWADYDNDGDLDILANKEVSCTSNIVVVFENNGNKSFAPVEFPSLIGLNDDNLNFTGDMEWGDIDNDGDADIILSGQTTCGNGYGTTKIYRNNGNKTFSPVANLVQQIYDVDVDWGDYDNDGDFDVFMYGDPFGAYSSKSRIYKNDDGKFKLANIDYLLESLQFGKATRGDIDNDGDLEYVILGELDYVNPRILVYKNTYAESWGKKNHPPSTPVSPASEVSDDQSVTLTWNAATDSETESMGLTYNVHLVDEFDSVIVNSYSLPNGDRKIVSTGNVKSGTQLELKNLKPGAYRWTVQAIDKGFEGSAFSEERSFVIDPVTGIGKELPQLSLSPNPADDRLKVVVNWFYSVTQLRIINSLGQAVLFTDLHERENNVDVSMLPPGVYMIAISRGSRPYSVQKIVKK